MCIAPGAFDTPMMGAVPDRTKTSRVKSNAFPQRLGTAEEFAHLCASIVQNPMLNGETIRLDGGIRMALL